MKEYWLLYSYFRRWWWLLLLGSTLGAIIGFGVNHSPTHPVKYVVTANLVVEDPEYKGEGSPPTVILSKITGRQATKEGAVEWARKAAIRLARDTDSPVIVQDLSIVRKITDEPRWKAGVLGFLIGTLLVIGGVYVWEDTREYLRRQQT
jgi:hypothetical protein